MVWKSTSAFYDEIVRVPLLIRYPPQLKPQRCDLAVDLTDLMPTLLELTGQRVPGAVQGQSLLPYLTGRAALAKARPYAFCERVSPNPQHVRRLGPATRGSFAVRGQGWKYIRYPDGQESLYDLTADPEETRNRANDPECASRKHEMAEALGTWLKRTGWPGGKF